MDTDQIHTGGRAVGPGVVSRRALLPQLMTPCLWCSSGPGILCRGGQQLALHPWCCLRPRFGSQESLVSVATGVAPAVQRWQGCVLQILRVIDSVT